MKKIITLFTCCAIALFTNAASTEWKQVYADAMPAKQTQAIHPDKYVVYHLQEQMLKDQLFGLSEDPNAGIVISLPMPDGAYSEFKVWQASMMEPALAAQFPDIKTFTAVAVNNNTVTAKLDFTTKGFHAMVFDAGNTFFIDPFSNVNNNGYYLCYFKKDIRSNNAHNCQVIDEAERALTAAKPVYLTNGGLPPQQLKVNGSNKSTYKLALTCNGDYSIAVAYPAAPNISTSLSAMTTTMNRVNGVYEREVGIHMNFVARESELIFTNPTNDPFSANNSSSTLKQENQHFLDSVMAVWSSSYDIGHIFSTGSGGNAELGCVCQAGSKARGTTGQPDPTGDAFDIDFVVHEMGHQFGATHTFNSFTCGPTNIASVSAYEPGSGSTIMAYAGICGPGDNMQGHSDDYFHAKSLDQISDFISSPLDGGLCVVTTPSGNAPSTVAAFSHTYTIPYLTPFELTAPTVTDADHDSILYCWEEWDLGDLMSSFNDTKQDGPIFRSFKYTTSPTRVFPTLDKLLLNVTSYLGEKLPEVTRTLKFTLTVRDMYNGWGCFNTPTDKITLNVVNSSGPFAVVFPSDSKDYMQSGANATIKWNVANSDAAPVSCSNVDITLSVDGGHTYPYTLAANTPNDGSEEVSIPANIYAMGCRVKVKSVGNVFFDISNDNISIFPWVLGVANTVSDDAVNIYPVPANDVLHIDLKKDGVYELSVVNVMGQQVYKAQAAKQNSIDVKNWAAGVYNMQLINADKSERINQKIVIQ